MTATWMEDLREHLMSAEPSHWGYPPCPISMDLEGGSEGGPATCQPNAYLSPQSSHMWTGQLLPSTNPRLSAAFTKKCWTLQTLEVKQLLNVEFIRSQTTNDNFWDTQVTVKIQIEHSSKHYINERYGNNTVHLSPLLLIDNDAVYCSSNFVGVIIWGLFHPVSQVIPWGYISTPYLLVSMSSCSGCWFWFLCWLQFVCHLW